MDLLLTRKPVLPARMICLGLETPDRQAVSKTPKNLPIINRCLTLAKFFWGLLD